jgi:ferredoxin
MLETADGQTDLSRLACQTEVMADLSVQIPS